MGSTLITMKLMPASQDTDLEEIKNLAKKVVEEKQGKNVKFEEQPIAFGLKAVITFFEIPEDLELESIENALSEIENINSVQVTDMRRALG